jgi:hypothetical protein
MTVLVFVMLRVVGSSIIGSKEDSRINRLTFGIAQKLTKG